MVEESRVSGILRRGAVVLLAALVVTVGWAGFRAWGSWRAVERISFDAAEARASLEEHRSTSPTIPDEPPQAAAPPNPFDDVLAFLIVGSDTRFGDPTTGRADVILMFVLPPGDADPLLFSIPRDLWVRNPCTGAMSRINANLVGCGTRVSGPEQLAVAVEDFTGIGVDHFALFDFDGFQAVIDRVGGVEVCVDHAVRDWRSGLDLPAGCTLANGEQALAWVRSRHTQEMVGGRWRLMPDVSDLVRNERQQELVLQALIRLKTFRSVSELAAFVDDLAGTFVIDDELSLGNAVSLAWNLRSLDPDRIVRLVIPAESFLGPEQESALRPVEPFAETLRTAHPDADLILDGGGTPAQNAADQSAAALG